MARPFLTLNLPDRGLAAGTPVVASYNPRLLQIFRRLVLDEWQRRIDSDSDGALAAVDRLEFEKLRATLDLLIPEDSERSDA